jgi:branched-subunit amino acid aminotransferase/4-amino-4-deoxychorismate lyase
MTGFQNGIFRELSEIGIPITSLSINRGYGAFEFFEVINHKPFYGERHFARFRHSMHCLKLKTAFDDQLAQVVGELIDRTPFPDFCIKMFALPHDSFHDGCYDASLYIFPVFMPDYDRSLYENGAHLLLKNYLRFMPEVKSTNYLAGQFWSDEITDRQIVDVLFQSEGIVSETSRGNIFSVSNGKVTTPGQHILKGITRSIVIEILAGLGIAFEETTIHTSELLSADELFLSSTTKLILPVTQIDGTPVGNGKPGEITQRIMTEFQKIRESFRNE